MPSVPGDLSSCNICVISSVAVLVTSKSQSGRPVNRIHLWDTTQILPGERSAEENIEDVRFFAVFTDQLAPSGV